MLQTLQVESLPQTIWAHFELTKIPFVTLEPTLIVVQTSCKKYESTAQCNKTWQTLSFIHNGT